MRIRHQLLAAVGVAAALTALVMAALLWVARDSARSLQQQTDAHEVARSVANLLTLTNEMTAYGGERPALQWRLNHRHLLQTLERALRERDPPHPALLQLRRSADELPPLFERLATPVDDADGPLAQRRRHLLTERLLSELRELVEHRYRWASGIAAEQAQTQRWYAAMVVGAPAVLLLLLVALATLIVRRVLRPLTGLAAAAGEVRSGNLAVRIDSAADDELGDAARAFDAMTASLQQQSVAVQTAQQLLEAEVARRRDSEQALRAVTDNLPAFMSRLDADLRYRFLNAPLARTVGGEAAALGRTMREVRGEAAFRQIAPHAERALRGEACSFELYDDAPGRRGWYQASYIPEFDAQGRPCGFFAITFDVSERKAAEARLRESEDRLRTIMESSPLGIFVADLHGRCEYVNPAWQRMTGLSLAQALGDGWRRALHPDDIARATAIWSAGADLRLAGPSEHRYLRPDGSVVWVRRNAADLHGADGIVGRVGMVEDITERRSLDAELAARTDELKRSNQELEQFAYVASHDLQEPLRMVNSYAQLLERRHAAKLDGEMREFVDFMSDGARRAQALIADLLQLARVNSRAQPFEPVPLREVLDETLRALGVAVAESGARVTHDALPTVLADRRQIGQLLQNLIGNALKFRSAERTPQIHVEAARDDSDASRWRVAVRDNGIGIEPRFHQRVFVLFQRLHLRDEYPGTGIGLAICKKVVERHGGRIGVDSVPGQGATFWFTLADAGVQTIAPAAPETAS